MARILCNCGFYANEDMDGMCSKCFNNKTKMEVYDDLFNQEIILIKLAYAKELEAIQNKINNGMVRSEKLTPKSTNALEKEGPKCLPERLKCAVCKQKLGLLPLLCRCEQALCSRHLIFSEHKCTFDYKGEGRNVINKENPKVVAKKNNMDF